MNSEKKKKLSYRHRVFLNLSDETNVKRIDK